MPECDQWRVSDLVLKKAVTYVHIVLISNPVHERLELRTFKPCAGRIVRISQKDDARVLVDCFQDQFEVVSPLASGYLTHLRAGGDSRGRID